MGNFFIGGNDDFARSLLARINAIEAANVIKDIIKTPNFHFHKLKGNMQEFFAIDVKTRRNPWRIILRPLNDNRKPYKNCNIDEVADKIQIVEIKEVSNHYE